MFNHFIFSKETVVKERKVLIDNDLSLIVELEILICLIFFIYSSISYSPMSDIFPDPSMLICSFKHVPQTQVYPWQHSLSILDTSSRKLDDNRELRLMEHSPFGGIQLEAGGFGSWTCWSSTLTKKCLP